MALDPIRHHTEGERLGPGRQLPPIRPPEPSHVVSTRLEETKAPSPSSVLPPPTGGVGKGLAAIALSGPLYASIGSALVTVPVTLYGTAGFALIALWTAVNEYRNEVRKGGSSSEASSELADGTVRQGLSGFLKEMTLSPGIAAVGQSGCYLYSMAVAVKAGEPFVSAVLFAFAIGAAAAAHVANLSYNPPFRIPMRIEQAVNNVWYAFPERVRIVLSDPGASFCSGNLALILHQLDVSKVFSNLWSGTLMTVGGTLATLGVVRGFLPLLRGSAAKPSGTASLLGGVGDLALGTSSCYAGSGWTGGATICWAIANINYGLKVGSSFVTRIFSKKEKS